MVTLAAGAVAASIRERRYALQTYMRLAAFTAWAHGTQRGEGSCERCDARCQDVYMLICQLVNMFMLMRYQDVKVNVNACARASTSRRSAVAPARVFACRASASKLPQMASDTPVTRRWASQASTREPPQSSKSQSRGGSSRAVCPAEGVGCTSPNLTEPNLT